MNSHGYELELRLNHVFPNECAAWLNANMTHAVNEVKFKDDAPLLPDYQKAAGHAIDQVYSYIDHGNLATWDDVIGSSAWTPNITTSCRAELKHRDSTATVW